MRSAASVIVGSSFPVVDYYTTINGFLNNTWEKETIKRKEERKEKGMKGKKRGEYLGVVFMETIGLLAWLAGSVLAMLLDKYLLLIASYRFY